MAGCFSDVVRVLFRLPTKQCSQAKVLKGMPSSSRNQALFIIRGPLEEKKVNLNCAWGWGMS